MGNQFPRANIERAYKMAYYHFKEWGCGGYKCKHCPKKVDTYAEASRHYNTMHRDSVVHLQ